MSACDLLNDFCSYHLSYIAMEVILNPRFQLIRNSVDAGCVLCNIEAGMPELINQIQDRKILGYLKKKKCF